MVFSFIVEFYNGIGAEPEKENGLIIGKTFAQVAKKLEELYGDICNLHLEAIDDSEAVILTKNFQDVVDDIKEHAVW